MSLTPPSLPPYIFLMSDHTTKQLAVDVAEELSARYPSVFIDDFLAPIHDAYVTMFDLDWKRDMSAEIGTLPNENDTLVSLEKWFIDEFGETKLGQMARQRSDERNTMADYITVYRDATDAHLKGFNWTDVRDFKIVTLTSDSTVESTLTQLGA